jgi:hypothetical protein
VSLPSLPALPPALALDVEAFLVLLLLWALVALRRRRIRRAKATTERTRHDPGAPSRPSSPAAPPAIPASAPGAATTLLSEAELVAELRRRLAGTPLDAPTGTANLPPVADRVIWVENGRELLVYLDSLAVRLRPGLLLASLDVEADQAGRTTVVVPFALSEPGAGSLVAVTEERARGDPAVVTHWGTTLQEALWAALLGVATDTASQHGRLATELAADEGALHLRSAPVAASVGVAAGYVGGSA